MEYVVRESKKILKYENSQYVLEAIDVVEYKLRRSKIVAKLRSRVAVPPGRTPESIRDGLAEAYEALVKEQDKKLKTVTNAVETAIQLLSKFDVEYDDYVIYATAAQIAGAFGRPEMWLELEEDKQDDATRTYHTS